MSDHGRQAGGLSNTPPQETTPLPNCSDSFERAPEAPEHSDGRKGTR